MNMPNIELRPCPHCDGYGQIVDNAAMGAWVRERRERRGFLAIDLAKRLDISPQYLNDLENGRRRWRPHLVMSVKELLKR